MKRKILKVLKNVFIIVILFIVIRLFIPTWTPQIKGENSISELRKVDIDGASLEIMIRGTDKANPVTDIVTEINIPVYFVMGKYDGMTSPKAAGNYLDSITGEGEKELILFDESAHYPQFEEEAKFYQWMKDTV